MQSGGAVSSTSFKSELFEQFARVGKALSSGVRLEILELLAQSERSVEDLAKVLGQSIANVSQHLQQLRQIGLVLTRREGQFVFYRIANDDIIQMIILIEKVAQNNIANINMMISEYISKKDSLEPVSAEELLEQARLGLVTVLDVRPLLEYSSGHLPNAVNVPLEDLEKRLAEFPKDKEVVAYCRGPYCMIAFEAVAKLREKGLRARRLKDGFPAWRLSGLPVEVDDG
jgi:rhodanese-related sulfurtransferase/predicted transcriptional regulator